MLHFIIALQMFLDYNQFSNSVIHLYFFSRNYTEPDNFLGVIRIPVGSINFDSDRQYEYYNMSSIGKLCMINIMVGCSTYIS